MLVQPSAARLLFVPLPLSSNQSYVPGTQAQAQVQFLTPAVSQPLSFFRLSLNNSTNSTMQLTN